METNNNNNEPKIVEVDAVAFIKDGQDGGGYTCIYPNLEALRDAEFPLDDYEDEDEANRKWEEVLDGDDTYENGEVDHNAGFKVAVYPDGKIELVGNIHASWGQ